MKIFKRIRFKRLIWVIIILAGIMSILAIGGYWTLNQPRVHRHFQDIIQEQWGIGIRWDSLSWSLKGWLKIKAPSVDIGQDSIQFHLTADVLSLSNLFSGKSDVEIDNASVLVNSARIVSVSKTALRWDREISISKANIWLDRIYIDPIALSEIDFSLQETASSTQFDFSWLNTIHFSRAQFNSPAVRTRYLAEGAVQIDANDAIANVSAKIVPDSTAVESFVNVRGAVFPFAGQLRDMELVVHNFPVSVRDEAAASFIVNGTISAKRADEGDLNIHSGISLNEIVYEIPSSPAVEIPSVTSDVFARLSSEFSVMNSTGTIAHSSFPVDTPFEKPITIPSGQVNFSWNTDEASPKTLTADGVTEYKDRYSLRVNDFPETATPAWHSQFRMTRAVDTLLSQIPFSPVSALENLKGNLSLTGQCSGTGSAIENYRAEVVLDGVELGVTNLFVKNASMHAVADGQGSLSRLKVQGNAAAGYSFSTTQAIEIEPAFLASGWYDYQKNEYEFVIDSAEAGIVQSVSGWLKTGMNGCLEGDISLEDSAKRVRDYLPVWGNELEGMGGFHLSAQCLGNDMTLRLFSPDFMLYSMADDYSYGAQLRDFTVEGRIQTDNPAVFNAHLSAASPFITYGARELEWPDDSLALVIQSGENEQIESVFYPPGGGLVSMGLSPEQIILGAADIDIQSFLLPVAQRFILNQSGEQALPFSIDGRINSNVFLQQNQEQYTINGSAHLALNELFVPLLASLDIQNSTITIPLVFPIDYENFAGEKLLFHAERIGWDDGHRENVVFDLPLDSKTLTIASGLTFPLFGGTVSVDRFAVNNWLSGDFEIDSAIRLDDIKLEKVSSILPVVPAEGIASGAIERIVFSNGRIELKGELTFRMFGGSAAVRDVFIRDAFGGAKILGFSADIERLDLQKLAAYFQYGEITGILSGHMRNVQLIVPPPGSDDLIMPDRLDIEIYSDSDKEGSISRTTLMKIIELSGKSDMDLSRVGISKFRYSKIGLHVLLDGIELRLIGTLDDKFLLAPTKSWFDHKIGIRLASSERTLDFLDFWNKLLAQTGRLP